MPPAVRTLKRKHSLKGKSILPVIKRNRLNEVSGSAARMATQVRSEDLDTDELITQFRQITGESAADCLEMAGKVVTKINLIYLLHNAIVYANEVGQPGEPLNETTQSDRVENEGDNQTASKPANQEKVEKKSSKEKTEDEILSRIEVLEKATESVESLKEKVRGLSLQKSPNEAMILLLLEELANVARKKQHEESSVFEELSRQALKHQGSVNLLSLVLNVVGGSSDVVIKALNKCAKEKKVESKLKIPEKTENENTHQSPLANVYNPFLMPQQLYQYVPYQNYSMFNSRPRGRFNQWKPRGNCYFCDMPGHSIRECQKMKLAKEQRK
ncbi:uncharacterized protein LOC134252893 [Saccostrea cucullata]|uniref:uncharacterized protein LOC134252893 n=1 Tax=Saccostrea cuccullata TaxID=36930 RepID=UPI002ED36EEC